MSTATIPEPRTELLPVAEPECWICHGPIAGFMKDCDNGPCREVQAALNAADKRADDV